MITIQNQNFGVEIELTGITREKAAQVISGYFGGTATTWKCMRDISISPEINVRGHRRSVSEGRSSDDHRCEVVTPILQYEDLEALQEIIRKLREAGAIANSSCGIHVHVDGANHTPDSLTRLINFAVGRQDLFYEALEIGDRENRWCKKINANLLKAMKHDSVRSRESMERIWYSSINYLSIVWRIRWRTRWRFWRVYEP